MNIKTLFLFTAIVMASLSLGYQCGAYLANQEKAPDNRLEELSEQARHLKVVTQVLVEDTGQLMLDIQQLRRSMEKLENNSQQYEIQEL